MSACPFSDPRQVWDDFRDVRETPGLFWNDEMNRWVVSRYDDIVEALHDPTTYSSQPVIPTLPVHIQEIFAGKVPDRGTLIGHDNPTHDRLRVAVNSFFMPRRIARYEPWIEAQAHALIDDFYEEGELDFRARFSSPLPLKVISHIVGLNPDRSDEYHEALLFFSQPSPERVEPLLAFHTHVEEVIAARKVDRRDDLISHVWNMRDSGDAVMTDFEMLSLFPGLMLAGHETSSNLIVMALVHLLATPGAYEAAQESDESRVQALEEAFRYEGPIMGMPRSVTRAVTLGGQELAAGAEVFLAYASGNRDGNHFADGDRFDPGRQDFAQHIAFGQGIHACLGAPLARLLLKIELRVIAERLPGIRFALPYSDRSYFPVREVRALVETPFAWDVIDSHKIKKVSATPRSEPASDESWIDAFVSQRHIIADDVVEITIKAGKGKLPGWAPGAHAEIELRNGVVRQYSLCGRPDVEEWTIAVRHEPSGRGGSAYIFDALQVGDALRVRQPRNHFPLLSTQGSVRLIAGGIGITPLLAMAEELERTSADWQLVYLGKLRTVMAYVDRLNQLGSDKITIWESEENGRINLEELIEQFPATATVYCCGPDALLCAAEGICDRLGLTFYAERFTPRQLDTANDKPFDVVIESTGREIHVEANETLLQALTQNGIRILSTCQEGTCGSCEIAVVSGDVLHRDSVLSREEKVKSETMMCCVSRSAGSRLVLKL